MLSQPVTPDLWLVEFERGLPTRLTFSEGGEAAPVWSPDSRRLAFRSSRTANFSFDLFWKDVDGTAEETSITPKLIQGTPNDWSPDGRFLLFTQGQAQNSNSDLFALSLEQKLVHPILQSPFAESAARLSADERWMAYVSNESGQNEVYVRPFTVAADGTPSVGAKWRVSTTGGVVPRWRGDGRELFYRSAAGDFMAVDVKATGETVQTSLPRKLFPHSRRARVGRHRGWPAFPDLESTPLDGGAGRRPGHGRAELEDDVSEEVMSFWVIIRRMSLRGAGVFVVFTGLLSSAAQAPVTAGPAAVPTFTRDVAPILYKNCVSCHRAGESAPMPLLTFSDARPWAKAIRLKVVNREMPPWGADRAHGEFANDPSLSEQDISTIAEWVDAGAPEGAAKDLPRGAGVPRVMEDRHA